jgi:hypothetical protein
MIDYNKNNKNTFWVNVVVPKYDNHLQIKSCVILYSKIISFRIYIKKILFPHKKCLKLPLLLSILKIMDKKTKKQNRKQTETEIINVTIPYITIPTPSTPSDITDDDTVLQTDDTQEESRDDTSSDDEAKTEIIVNTSEKKNSWVWSFTIKCK